MCFKNARLLDDVFHELYYLWFYYDGFVLIMELYKYEI